MYALCIFMSHYIVFVARLYAFEVLLILGEGLFGDLKEGVAL